MKICWRKRRRRRKRPKKVRKIDVSKKTPPPPQFFVAFFLTVVCVWLKDVLITIRWVAKDGWGVKGGGQAKASNSMADRLLIALFVVEIFHLDGAHYEETKENWTIPQKKRRWEKQKKCHSLKKRSSLDQKQDDGNRQIVRLTKHKVSTQNSNFREVWRQQTPSVMQNWFQFMALLLQIKKKRKERRQLSSRVFESIEYYFATWTFMYSCRIILSRSQQLFKLLLKFTFVFWDPQKKIFSIVKANLTE